jgi:hypothetical protein
VAFAAGATTLVAQDVAKLTANSDLVVRATVARASSRWAADRLRIVTLVELQVAETYQGAPASTVQVLQPGGVVGDVGQSICGTASFSEGEEVVVFLEANPGGKFLVTGMAQGKFRVERSTDGRAVFAVPELEVDARLVDPATGQSSPAASQARVPLKLDELVKQIRVAAKPLPVDAVATPAAVKVR